MRLSKALLAMAAAVVVTVVFAVLSDDASKPANEAAPTKTAATELTVDLKVKGMT